MNMTSVGKTVTEWKYLWLPEEFLLCPMGWRWVFTCSLNKDLSVSPNDRLLFHPCNVREVVGQVGAHDRPTSLGVIQRISGRRLEVLIVLRLGRNNGDDGHGYCQ